MFLAWEKTVTDRAANLRRYKRQAKWIRWQLPISWQPLGLLNFASHRNPRKP
jgi:hypothetical protein